MGGTICDELRNVLSADEERLELPAERRCECSRPRCADFQPGISEQFAGVLGKATFIGKCDS